MTIESQDQIQKGKRRVINNILCPTNLSPTSDEALRYGVAFARAYNAKLYLCYVAENSKLMPLEEVNKFFVDSIAPYISETDSPWLNWEGIISNGEPEQVIIETAKEKKVDLIVMRSRRRPYAAMLLGSTTEAICHTAPCPVLVTHQEEREWVDVSSQEIGLKKVLVAYDFSSHADLALDYGLSLAQEFQAQLHLMNILPDKTDKSESEPTDYSNELAYLRNLIPSEVELWSKLIPVIVTGRPYQQILSYAQENNIDLIAMGARGKEANTIWSLFGSNVDRVLRQASCPVLVAHLPETETQES